MAAYEALGLLGEGLQEVYSEENRAIFHPSLLAWLQEEKLLDKLTEFKSMVSDWERLLEAESLSRSVDKSKFSSILSAGDESEDEDLSSPALNEIVSISNTKAGSTKASQFSELSPMSKRLVMITTMIVKCVRLIVPPFSSGASLSQGERCSQGRTCSEKGAGGKISEFE